ncbi:hypothetical protein ACFZAE_22830 [Streptomyces scabiei]|uniref:hypothetical protein n=1 Tax=Streptomyces scabiei TaxID=1930 RepID=UPI0036E6AEF7
MGGVLASGLSAAPISAGAATSSTAARTASSERARLRALYRQAVAEGGRLVVFTGDDRSGQDDFLKNAFAKTFPERRVDIVVEPAAAQGRAGARNRARADVTSAAGRTGIFDRATMNPHGLGPLMSDPGRPRPPQGPPQPLHRRYARRRPVRRHVLSLHPIDQQGTQG